MTIGAVTVDGCDTCRTNPREDPSMNDDDTTEADTAPPLPPRAAVPVAEELAAMRKLHAALEALDRSTQVRVLSWLFDRYEVAP